MNGRPPEWDLIRDIVLTMVAIAMLGFETLSGRSDEVIVGAAIAILGLPPLLRWDKARRNGD